MPYIDIPELHLLLCFLTVALPWHLQVKSWKLTVTEITNEVMPVVNMRPCLLGRYQLTLRCNQNTQLTTWWWVMQQNLSSELQSRNNPRHVFLTQHITTHWEAVVSSRCCTQAMFLYISKEREENNEYNTMPLTGGPNIVPKFKI